MDVRFERNDLGFTREIEIVVCDLPLGPREVQPFQSIELVEQNQILDADLFSDLPSCGRLDILAGIDVTLRQNGIVKVLLVCRSDQNRAPFHPRHDATGRLGLGSPFGTHVVGIVEHTRYFP